MYFARHSTHFFQHSTFDDVKKIGELLNIYRKEIHKTRQNIKNTKESEYSMLKQILR